MAASAAVHIILISLWATSIEFFSYTSTCFSIHPSSLASYSDNSTTKHTREWSMEHGILVYPRSSFRDLATSSLSIWRRHKSSHTRNNDDDRSLAVAWSPIDARYSSLSLFLSFSLSLSLSLSHSHSSSVSLSYVADGVLCLTCCSPMSCKPASLLYCIKPIIHLPHIVHGTTYSD